ncbi:SDR family NAD(P)-dependent oxidoreductase [Actinomadura sp. HBU206391]|uniref:SDR family NAD(P)-dependent oxidoreductase n=1 Tax=Actinomadura sp. HBU206391 TaxID=2731692 RepID=UPI00165020A0|nr:SDR family NAD(P)-dependent oxidoreductase [Actinomadura sp. HBU206391]MBC6456529.1 SDR family NAD(P)-dependent oxidoreductase [Actinomadura sp. HBU206391]
MTRVFLLTGSSRGLGRQIAEAALADGHRLLATARDPRSLADLTQRYGDRVRTVALDVTDPAAAEAAVRTAVEAFGRLDVVVNNAGYADLASVEDITAEAFRAQIDTNLLGVVNVTKAALPVLREQGSGHIIQISSVGDRVTTAGLSAYQAAKWGVAGFSEALAQEVAPLGIKVTVLEPGGMRTDWAGSSMSIPPISEPYQQTVGAMARLRDGGAGNAAGDPAKVAQVVLKVVELDRPPVRLLLGSDAVRYAAAVEQARADADAQWRELSLSTDHDSATAAELDPLGEL